MSMHLKNGGRGSDLSHQHDGGVLTLPGGATQVPWRRGHLRMNSEGRVSMRQHGNLGTAFRKAQGCEVTGVIKDRHVSDTG